jgi:LysR family hydrogen peroxide-inducible transcriptional activator
MNFQQLNYVIAVNEFRHFGEAAKHCHVTQPTLSMMIKKLEDELDATLFDRTKQPVMPTDVGRKVIAKACNVIREMEEIPELVQQHRGKITGKLRIGIIPTLAPYLLPLFVQSMINSYPDIELQVKEMATDNIKKALKKGNIDVGILVTPLDDDSLVSDLLFYEQFYAYVSKSHQLFNKMYILPEDININQLWLPEEGHCLRSQIINLCEASKSQVNGTNFKYEAGSIESLKKIVEQSSGITILPELAILDMDNRERKRLRSFRKPEPVREVSLVTHRTFIKKRLVDVLKEKILDAVPKEIRLRERSERVLNNH